MRLKKIISHLFFSLIHQMRALFSNNDIAYLGTFKWIPGDIFLSNINNSQSIEVDQIFFPVFIKKYKKIVVPNGQLKKYMWVYNMIPSEKKIYAEIGFFPQGENLYLDPKGVHASSSIAEMKMLPELSPALKDQLDHFRKIFLSKNYVKNPDKDYESLEHVSNETLYSKDQFIFIPLQLEGDTAFKHQPFRSNQQFIDFVEAKFPNVKLIFKLHPSDLSSYKIKNKESVLLDRYNQDLKSLIKHCFFLISLNSTVILEALMHGKKVAALGKGLFSNKGIVFECGNNLETITNIKNWEPNKESIDRFLSLLISKQIKIKFSPEERISILEKFRQQCLRRE